jgi:hypothetical protein
LIGSLVDVRKDTATGELLSGYNKSTVTTAAELKQKVNDFGIKVYNGTSSTSDDKQAEWNDVTPAETSTWNVLKGLGNTDGVLLTSETFDVSSADKVKASLWSDSTASSGPTFNKTASEALEFTGNVSKLYKATINLPITASSANTLPSASTFNDKITLGDNVSVAGATINGQVEGSYTLTLTGECYLGTQPTQA